VILKIGDASEIVEKLGEICSYLSRGGVIVYPTETLYGLGASVFSPLAVKRVFDLKNRPQKMPVSVAFSSPTGFEKLFSSPPWAIDVLRGLVPGPVTVVVPFLSSTLPEDVVPLVSVRAEDVEGGFMGYVGVRVPEHPVATAILERCGPMTSTSANRHGRPPTPDEAMGFADVCGYVVVDAGGGVSFSPSTVVRAEKDGVILLRRGMMGVDDIVRRCGLPVLNADDSLSGGGDEKP